MEILDNVKQVLTHAGQMDSKSMDIQTDNLVTRCPPPTVIGTKHKNKIITEAGHYISLQ